MSVNTTNRRRVLNGRTESLILEALKDKPGGLSQIEINELCVPKGANKATIRGVIIGMTLERKLSISLVHGIKIYSANQPT